MGVDLFYKAEDRSKENVKKINNFLLNELEINKNLESPICLYDEEDIEWAKENNYLWLVEYYKKHYGMGVLRVSSDFDEKMFELYTQIFEELNKRFKIKYYARSCAFDEDEYYFTIEQIKRITQNGKRLSGKSSKYPDVRETYQKWLKILSK